MSKVKKFLEERGLVVQQLKTNLSDIRAQAETIQKVYTGVIRDLDDEIKKAEAEEAEQQKRMEAERKERAEKAKAEFKESALRIWESAGGSAESFEKNFEEIYQDYLKAETARRMAGDGGAAQYAQTVRGWNE
jgi:septal ring factor EnvC (AmiA/AmiB activator)